MAERQELIGKIKRLTLAVLAAGAAGTLGNFMLPYLRTAVEATGWFVTKCPIFFPLAIASLVAAGVLCSCLSRFGRAGIVRVEFSLIRGRGGCQQIMERAKTDFWFLGLTARRWFEPGNGDLFKTMATRVGVLVGRPIRVLVMDPESDFVPEIAAALQENPAQIRHRIEDTIDRVRTLRASGVQIELRTYDQRPVFRVAAINQREAYLSFYRPVGHKDRQPELVFDHHQGQSFYVGVIEYFEAVWRNASIRVPWSEGESRTPASR